MAKRFELSRKHSKKMFHGTAKRVHPKNRMGTSMVPGYVMRGGIRL